MPPPPSAGPAFAARELTLDAPAFDVLATALLAEPFRLRFRATGNSMRPLLLDGDILTVASVRIRHPRRGDVVLCRARVGLVAHRVVRIERAGHADAYRIRGDAACGDAERLSADQLLGVVTLRERHGRNTRLDAPAARLPALAWVAWQNLRGWVRRRLT